MNKKLSIFIMKVENKRRKKMLNQAIINVANAGNKWRVWRELLNAISEANKCNYDVWFDEDGFFTDNESEREEYAYIGYENQEIAVENNDKAYDLYNDAIAELAKELNAELSLPYGNSWYITKNDKTITLRDHDVASSTMRYHNEIYSIRHDGGINVNDLRKAIEWINE